MKILKFLRDIILMLYVCVFILLVVCYFLGLSAAVVTTPNEFSNIEVGSLVLFKSEEFFGSLPWFGYVLMWLKTIPGMIIFGLFTALIFGSFIFEIVKNKKRKKLNVSNELIEEKISNDTIDEDINDSMSNEEVDSVETIDDSITNESEDNKNMEFDTMNFNKINLVDDDTILNSTLEDAESIIEETNEITNNNIENIDNVIFDGDYGNEDIVGDTTSMNVEDTISEEEVVDNVDTVEEVDTVNEENVEDKYLNSEGGVEDMYMDNIPETENIPEDVIENIEKHLDSKVAEAKNEVKELSQIPDSIDRDMSDFESILNSGDIYNNVDYRQMSLADLEAASEDPVLMSMDFSNHVNSAEEIPEDFVDNLKKELELKTEEVNILKDKLTSMENIDIADIDSKLKAIEKDNAKLHTHLDEVIKENSLKDEVISELNETLNTSKTYIKEVENALSDAIDDRENLSKKLNEYEDKMSNFNDFMDSNAKKVENYDLMYERYIATLKYLAKKDSKISVDSVDREIETFNINK